MACMTAIIASNVGGNSELIENGVNGMIIDPQDTDSFVEQITTLLNNVELRKSLENQALNTVKQYDWNQVGNLYLNIYESVLDKSK
jgi:glycosyltransferase involved in cell wall biosynthesis